METTAEPSRSLADGDWVSTAEAARRLGLASRTVYRLIDTGDLPEYRFGRVIRLKGYDLDRFVEHNRIGPGHLKHLHNLETTDDASRRSGEYLTQRTSLTGGRRHTLAVDGIEVTDRVT